MSWLRLDDSFDSHPKIVQLSEQNRWRWTRALLWCARHFTNGNITAAALREIGLTRALPQLLDLGLLRANPDQTYEINDFARYNRPDITAAARQQRWRDKQSSVTANGRDENVSPRAGIPSLSTYPSTKNPVRTNRPQKLDRAAIERLVRSGALPALDLLDRELDAAGIVGEEAERLRALLSAGVDV